MFLALSEMATGFIKRLTLVPMALLLLGSDILAQEEPEPRDPHEYFFTQSFGDLPEELKEAKKLGKIGLMLFFEQDGCAYCRAMMNKVLNQRQVQDWYGKRFVSIAVDIRGDVELTDFDGVTLPSKAFAIQRRAVMTPVITFIDLDGSEIFRKWGMVATPEEFLLMGAYIEDKRYLDISFDDYARQKGREPGPEVFLTPVDGHEK
jgi:thioredoxin-related protein